MKYTVNVKGEQIEVDGLEFGITRGSPTGNVELYLKIIDGDQDIYTADKKKRLWTGWVNDCCADNSKPENRIRRVEAKVMGGKGNGETYRTVVIENGYLASFRETAERGGPNRPTPTQYQYEAIIRRSPVREGDVSVKAA